MTPVDAALFLSGRVGVIATREDAGTCFMDIKRAVDEIERAINRPIPPMVLGPCPAIVSDQRGTRGCGIALTATRKDVEVQCPSCKTVFNIERLLTQQLEDTADMSFTLSELYKLILPVMRQYVALRTLQDWVKRGKLIATGYAINGEPRFLLSEVRKLRELKTQKNPTGAAAHKTRCG